MIRKHRWSHAPAEDAGHLEQLLHGAAVSGVDLLRIQLYPRLRGHQRRYLREELDSLALILHPVYSERD